MGSAGCDDRWTGMMSIYKDAPLIARITHTTSPMGRYIMYTKDYSYYKPYGRYIMYTKDYSYYNTYGEIHNVHQGLLILQALWGDA